MSSQYVFDVILTLHQRGFNVGVDLSTLLAVFTVLTDADIETESWYLGTAPNKVRVSTVMTLSNATCLPIVKTSMFAAATTIIGAFAAQDPTKQFTLDAMGKHYAKSAIFSQKNNPYLYFFPSPSIVSLGAFVFYANFFSNGTYGAGSVANYESISSIIGAKFDEETGQFQYVPERMSSRFSSIIRVVIDV